MFEKQIIDKILNAWSRDQAHPYRDRKQKPLPDPQDVRVIIETAFLASLKREEGKPITFCITLLSKDCVMEECSSGRKQVIMTFEQSLPFSQESITKISPAFDSTTTSLIVAPGNDRSSDYEIWGAMFYGPSLKPLEEIPVGIEGLTLFRPDVMMVTAIAPGSLLISRGSLLIGRFLYGDFVKSTPTPFYSKAMGNYTIETIKDNEGFKRFQNHYWQVHTDTLNYLLSEVSVRGHGGIIVILPNSKVEEYKKLVLAKYSFEEKLNSEALLIRVLDSSKSEDISFIMAMNRRFSERLDLLAQLACIDGALIISSNLNLISFGSTLIARKWDRNILIGPDGFGGGGENWDASKWGTKHNSAINFVGACPGSIAFVISQDGPVRGFVKKDEETVLCWPDCLVSMFV